MNKTEIQNLFKQLQNQLSDNDNLTAETHKNLLLIKVKVVELEMEIFNFMKNPSIKDTSAPVINNVNIGDNSIGNKVDIKN